MASTIDEDRAVIDKIDATLLRVLAARVRAGRVVVAKKALEGRAGFDGAREGAIRARLEELRGALPSELYGALSPELVNVVWTALFRETRG